MSKQRLKNALYNCREHFLNALKRVFVVVTVCPHRGVCGPHIKNAWAHTPYEEENGAIGVGDLAPFLINLLV